MDDFSDIIVYMAPWPVYEKISVVASYVAGLLTPTLLMFAIVFRTFETQLGGFEGNAKWATASKDFFLWGSVLTLYFLLGNLLTDFFNTVYAALAANEDQGGLGGSLTAITEKLLDYIAQAEQLIGKDEGPLDALTQVFAGGALAMAYFVYYLTIIAVAFVTIFMRLAFALGFGIVYIWGLVAVPLAITSSLKMLKGWGIFAGGILLWPIIEAVIIALLIPVFDVAVSHLLGSFDSASANKAGIYAIFSILNLVLMAVMIAAPFVAGALAANNSAMSGLVMPFVGSALAATAGMGSALMRRTAHGSEKAVLSSAGWAGDKMMNTAKMALPGRAPGNPHQFRRQGASGDKPTNPTMSPGAMAASADSLNKSMTAPDSPEVADTAERTPGSRSKIEKKSKQVTRRKAQVRGYFRNKQANLKRIQR